MKTSKVLLGAAIAGIVAGGATFVAISDASASSKKVKCYNACTGQGACKTATHACKGQNGCEGDGKVIELTVAECVKTGGYITKPKTPAFPMPPITPPAAATPKSGA